MFVKLVTCILVVSILAFFDVQTFSAALMSVFLRHSFFGGAECFTVRRFERERDGMHCALNNPSVQTELREGTSTRAGGAYPFSV